MVRIGWLTSARDEQSVRLLRESLDNFEGSTDLKIVAVALADPDGRHATDVLSLGSSRGIESVTGPSLPDPSERATREPLGAESWRASHESRIVRGIAPSDIDILMLSGYMLVAGKVLLDSFGMLNLHPALPGGPVGTQRRVIDEIIESNLESAGAMIHLVTEQLDRGPVAAVSRIDLSNLATEQGSYRDVPDEYKRDVLRKEITDREPTLVIAALRHVAQHGMPPSCPVLEIA